MCFHNNQTRLYYIPFTKDFVSKFYVPTRPTKKTLDLEDDDETER